MGSSHFSSALPLPRHNPRSIAEEDEVAGTPGSGGGGMRLGLHVEQRGELKHLVRSLKLRLDAASSDLQVTHVLWTGPWPARGKTDWLALDCAVWRSPVR